MLGMPVIVYLFLGGCGAGVLCVISLWSALFHRSLGRSQVVTETFSRLKASCFLIGFALLLLSAGCLMLDLGRPERMYLLFVRPTASLLSFGSFALLAGVLLAGFLALVNMFYLPWVSAGVKKVAEILCVIVVFMLMAYTGLYLQNVTAVALWTSVFVPILFVLSSLSAGLSLVFACTLFIRDAALLEPRVKGLHKLHFVVIAVEILALIAFVATTVIGHVAPESVALLFGDDLGMWFAGGLVVLGLLIPLGAEGFALLTNQVYRLLPVDLLCLLGGFFLRYCIVFAGLH